ncbi:hypothetical protein IFM89_012271 [Coptis chinensis]|uniref:Endonuclease/exonuclease/phosphatase domain-containing protein n=1 Tax=Coptis chinensis TaxID=261450 RepID=A0A835HA46_9MAGN|nr:hypothetical protein IFM89_012271 [Coptis chinensis]
MKTLSWNCRGCGNASTMRHLHDLISVNNPDIVFLSETKASITIINSLIHQFNYPNHFIIPPVHLARVLGGKPYEYNDGEPAYDIINTQGFIDLGYKGYPYTWSNKKSASDNIQKRVDITQVNSEWLLLFPEVVLSHKIAIGSGHCPLLFNSQPPPHSSPVPFKFQSMWINHQDYKSVVNNSWNTSSLNQTQLCFLLKTIWLLQKKL